MIKFLEDPPVTVRQRLDRVRALIDEGKLTPEIVSATGLAGGTIRQYAYRLRRLGQTTLSPEFLDSLPPIRMHKGTSGNVELDLPGDVKKRIDDEAVRRRVSSRVLVEDIVNTVARDDLFVAVLDK